MATGDEACLQEAKRYFDMVYGIYLEPATDPFRITSKTCAETRDTKSLAQPMILLNVASIMRQADVARYDHYDGIITKLIDDSKAFHKPEFGAMFEAVDAATNGVILESSPCRVINPGHDMECAWFMLEEAIRRKDDALADFSAKVFTEAFARGWDEEYGGITYFKDVLGLPVEAYEHDMKLWWPHNEAAIGSLMLYSFTKDERYLDIFQQVTDYAFDHFSDPEFGEWFGYLRRDGKPTEPPCKGHTYKGPFHVMRMLAKCMLLMEEML